MDNSTLLYILYGLNQLIHAEADLPLLKLVGFDMIKKLATLDLLHDDIHLLLSFIGFSHLHYVFMADKLDNLDFFS